MKTKHLFVAFFFGLCIASTPLLSHQAMAEVPSGLHSCLSSNPLTTSPQQYRELAKIEYGNETFYYLKVIYTSGIQPTQMLIKAKNTNCKVLIQDQNFLTSLTKFLPLKLAVQLAQARWKYDLSTPFGKEVVKGLTQSSTSSNLENGEQLDPLVLPKEDFIALQQLGYKISPDVVPLP